MSPGTEACLKENDWLLGNSNHKGAVCSLSDLKKQVSKGNDSKPRCAVPELIIWVWLWC